MSTPEELVESAELRARIRGAIDGLPRSQRETVYLFYLSGLTHREAATELCISINAVKARLHQARSNLGRVLIDLQPKEALVTTLPSTGFVAVRIADVRMSRQDTSPRFGFVLLETTPTASNIFPYSSLLQKRLSSPLASKTRKCLGL